jgi:CubicO group peptidase (beta-lactamase class C family)
MIGRPRHTIAILSLCIGVVLILGMRIPGLQCRVSALRSAIGARVPDMFRDTTPNVAWDRALPEMEGLPGTALDSLPAALGGGMALLVVRNGKLVFEWYQPRYAANSSFSTAALAKAVVGTMALLQMAADGLVGLDEPASTYIPAWRDDPDRAAITLRQLASHSSGLDNVHFPSSRKEEEWFAHQPSWQRRYFQNPDERFSMAITEVPMLFRPGTHYLYSGIGYYALAYALAAALEAGSGETLPRYLARRVYTPLGIPSDAWSMSYGRCYAGDGLRLYAIGSGGAFTARALARIGQAVLTQRQGPLAALWDSVAIQPARRSPSDPGAHLVPHLGWWGNEQVAWPSLPRDALVGLGAGNKVLLVIPSERLVVVYLGSAHSGPYFPADSEAALEEALFAPLSRSLRLEAGSAMASQR